MGKEINVYKGNVFKKCDLDIFKKEFYQYLQCENLNFLLGSGCSSFSSVDGKEEAIPTMAGLFSNFLANIRILKLLVLVLKINVIKILKRCWTVWFL